MKEAIIQEESKNENSVEEDECVGLSTTVASKQINCQFGKEKIKNQKFLISGTANRIQ